MVRIILFKESPDAVVPKIAYSGSSAAFDITCTETTLIPAKGTAIVPNGLRLSIPQNEPYFMTLALRSSMGCKPNLICHPGIIDAGYCGELGVKIFNFGDEDVTIEKGERYAQVLVSQKHKIEFFEMNKEEFEEYKKTQERGDKGFGSSGSR